LSADGRRLLLCLGDKVCLIGLRLSDDEIARRRWATRPDAAWHAAEAQRLTAERQPSAAAFHVALAAGLHPGAVGDLPLPAAQDRRPDADVAGWVNKRVGDWQPTADERRFDDVGWAGGIRDALKLARENNRPVFLFTNDGHMAVGRC